MTTTYSEPTETVSAVGLPYLLLSFVDTLADALEVAGALTLGAALLSSVDIPGAAWALTAGLTLLVILLAVQVGASFFCALDHLRLSLLGAAVSVGLALGVAAELARTLGWWGWKLLALSAAPALAIALVLLPVVAITRRHHLLPAHRRFLWVNLLAPTATVVGMAAWQLLF